MTKTNRFSFPARLLAGVVCVASLAACTPLVVGGALTGAMVAVDRRSSGAQLDDQGIELRASNRLRDEMGNRARVSVTSYNRHVLLTGEAANEAAKAEVEAVLRSMDNVGPIYNELGITNSPSFTEKASDGLLTGRVKAGLVEIRELSANAFKVVSERGTVYLMGRVSQKEADMATEVARTTKGATRVVRVMEILTEEELSRLPLAR
jgi:osmotically-inducible protein OsmY